MRLPRPTHCTLLVCLLSMVLLTTCSTPTTPVTVPDGEAEQTGQDVGVDSPDIPGDAPPPDQAGEVPGVDTDTEEPDLCVPSCLGMECGDDGCGGSCGACWAGESCFMGDCRAGGEAGGPCDDDEDCDDGTPCLSWEGADLCAPPCGPDEDCPEGWECITGSDYESYCGPPCEPTTCEALGASCGAPSDGCYGVLDCGECQEFATCTEAFACECTWETCGDECCGQGVPCVNGACQTGPPPCDPPCAPGFSCVDGTCCGTSDPTCDGLDDDCDGDTDEDWIGEETCGLGVCAENATPATCVDGIVTPCVPGEPLGPVDTTCDEVDDDCDGFNDDDFIEDATCGVGACKSTNIPSACVNGVVFDCQPGAPQFSEDSSCNGVDDDCNGDTDEDFVSESICGEGWCAVIATPSACVDGEVIPCTPGAPASEADTLCNAVDDDCDGQVDEDYQNDLSCGVGFCQIANNPSTCFGGVETPCSPGAPLSEVDATCDGIDDDCDGENDEDFVGLDGCGTGWCQVFATPSSCVDGVQLPCEPGEPLVAVDDDCDQIDGDCDGYVDEDALVPCTYGAPVIGAEVDFLTTLGFPAGMTEDHGDGTYSDNLLDLSVASATGQVEAQAWDTASDAMGISVVEGVPANLKLTISRDQVTQDEAKIRACVFAADPFGAPVSTPLGVTFSWDYGLGVLEAFGSAVGMGMHCAWLTAPAIVFEAGGAGPVVASVGVLNSQEVILEALAPPAPLELDPGTVGLRLPLGPRFPGTTVSVPVVVNTGGDVIGSYKFEVQFDTSVLEVIDLVAGPLGDLAPPVSNAETTANQLGSLSFNSINTNPSAGASAGTAVVVATINFKVRDDATPGAAGMVSGVAAELFNTVYVSLVEAEDMVIWSGAGEAAAATVTVDDPGPRALHAYVEDPTLMDRRILSGAVALTPLHVPALHRDGAVEDLAMDPMTSCDTLDEGIADASDCLVSAWGRGVTSAVVTRGALQTSAVIRVLTPTLPMSVQVDDGLLSYIVGLDELQHTRVRVDTVFTDDDLYAFPMDVTEDADFVAQDPSVASIPEGSRVVTAGNNGVTPILAFGFDGAFLGAVDLEVNGGHLVTVTKVEVLVPARLQITGVDPEPASSVPGMSMVTASLTNLLSAEGQSVQARGYLVFSDDVETNRGSRRDVTDSDAMTWGSTSEAAVIDEDGVLTAVAGGTGDVTASYAGSFGDEVASGAGPFEVQLPPPTKVVATVADPRIARSQTDSAHQILGLPLSRQITVVVHFADGSVMDLTADPRTTWQPSAAIIKVDGPCDGVPDCIPGRVSATDAGAGEASVSIGFDDPYLGVVSTTVDLEVVEHLSLDLALYELYTPPGELPVNETTLAIIEDTGVRQRARIEVFDQFSDGSSVEVTSNPSTSWIVTQNGSGAPSSGALTISGGIVQGNLAGLWELQALTSGNTSAKTLVVVSSGAADLVSLMLSYPGGNTLLGVKDLGTGALRVVGTFDDGTRNVLTGTELIPGLLAFVTTDPTKATVNAAGVATVHGNGPVTLMVSVATPVDSGEPFGTPASRYLPVNLTPAVGDVDMGATSGLPFPDRDGDEIFQVPLRVNTGPAALGGVDLEITYDPAVLEVMDASIGEDLPGGLFSANAGTPGVVYLNALPSLSHQVFGGTVEIAAITFKALKSPGGPMISPMGGTIVSFLDIDGEVIGQAPPQAIVAGSGDLDPAPGGFWGDADDDEGFSVGDVLFIQKSIVEPPIIVPDETQTAQSDLFPDGAVTSNDAFFGSQALARLVHFVEVSAASSAQPGEFDLTAVVTDRDQAPVNSGIRLRFEIGTIHNGNSMSFTLAHEASPSGVVTEAVSAGDGAWTTHVTGVTQEENMGVVALLDVLDAQGEVQSTTAFLGSKLLDPDATFMAMAFFGGDLCLPECAGQICGAADGCGGLCDGTCDQPLTSCQDGQCLCTFKGCGDTCCPEGDTCQGDVCCTPTSCDDVNAECGYIPDNCGNMISCGTCPGGHFCSLANTCGCQYVECGDACCLQFETCEAGICTPPLCQPDCEGKICGNDDGCGGLCHGPCLGVNQTCEAGVCTCIGPDCGGGCCAGDQICQGGVCVADCTPDCSEKLCGEDDGCGGDCEDAPCEDPDAFCLFGDCECLYVPCGDDCCQAGEICEDGNCTPDCAPVCDGAACGDPDGCGGLCDGPCASQNQVCEAGVCVCGNKVCGGECCDSGQVCSGSDCCTPTTCQALDAICGHPLDGCGNTLVCGDCPQNQNCGDDFQCTCPTTMCAGLCCPAGETCEGGLCVGCDPACDGKDCGEDDGCGGLCDGPCPDPVAQICHDGVCECLYVDCEGLCCQPGEVCENGACGDPCEPNCLGKDCGDPDGCGGLCDGSCLGTWEVCDAGICVCAYESCEGTCCGPEDACYLGDCCVPTTCDALGAMCGTPPDGCGGTITCDSCGPNTGCNSSYQCICLYESCGGTCCNEGDTCQEGACCPAMTCEDMGAECGTPEDGCGEVLDCGTCEDENTECSEWLTCECKYETCSGVCCGEEETCLDGACFSTCPSVCDGKMCGDDDGCGFPCTGPCPDDDESCSGGECVCEGVVCNGDCCPAGDGCVNGACVACNPDCSGKNCGDSDACGGTCNGPCPGDDQECQSGVCVCLYESCGGNCCGTDQTCHQGSCCTPSMCQDFPDVECGYIPDGCGGLMECGGCGAYQACSSQNKCDCEHEACGDLCCGPGQPCVDDTWCCEPSCQGKLCGADDECGGICDGECQGINEICQAGACQCEFLNCAGNCCGQGEACDGGLCVGCVSSCAGKACGDDDGCGELCDGACPVAGQECIAGICVCDGEVCGDVCCVLGEVCHQGSCCQPQTDCELAGFGCGGPSDGCGGVMDCGTCSGDMTCGPDFTCQCEFDDCDGQCCPDGWSCYDGACCDAVSCEIIDAECGAPSNGCGGFLYCGACENLEFCNSQNECQCLYETCAGLCCGPEETCIGGVCESTCEPSCAGKLCGDDDGCGLPCEGECSDPDQVCFLPEGCICPGILCGGDCCPDGEGCVDGVCAPCTPICDGAACGSSDGCGGICLIGSCVSDNAICVDGVCECNDPLCGEACCGLGQVCNEGSCCTPEDSCEDLGASCGEPSDGCGGTLACGACDSYAECNSEFQCECLWEECDGLCCDMGQGCFNGACCIPECGGAQCGDDDGCGGLCDGPCTGILYQGCVAGVCTCIYDDCGELCCGPGEVCEAGSCVACDPDCQGKVCGADDGCGGICDGTCPSDQHCFDGQCLCQFETCDGGCCSEGQLCSDGQCCTPQTCLGLGAECGAPDDGCGGGLDCGTCPAGVCTDAFVCECEGLTCDGSCCSPGEVCFQGTCCGPVTCEGEGIECGTMTDGCGAVLDCGACGENEECSPIQICACVDISCGGVCCEQGQTCEGGVCTGDCVPACAGALCGDEDGCGGLCDGSCAGANAICEGGACVCEFETCGSACCGWDEVCEAGVCSACQADCQGKACGAADGCGGLCDGPCAGDFEICEAGVCQCEAVTCGDACCAAEDVCVAGSCCTPQTCDDVNAECGTPGDGCGGLLECGICGAFQECTDQWTCQCQHVTCSGTCCEPGEVCHVDTCCAPSCAGKSCGEDDGCGGLCDGSCAEPWQICEAGQCLCEYLSCGEFCCGPGEPCEGGVCVICEASCDGKACGEDDGCEGLCDGPCPGESQSCIGGACVCDHEACGDLCCQDGEVCNEGACCAPSTCPSLGATCGAPSDGCGGTLDCGGCPDDQTCGAGFECECEHETCGGTCCGAGDVCHEGFCCTPATCDSLGATCGAPSDGCGGVLDCGGCTSLETCSEDFACVCTWEPCGDGCCLQGQACEAGVCQACVPDCDTAFCGDDNGCGGICDGACLGMFQVCAAGTCVCEFIECGESCCGPGDQCIAGVCAPCEPSCDNALCGDDDGCGGLCDGDCVGDNQECLLGICTCLFEACGEVCCADGDLCSEGVCCTPLTCDTANAACGEPADGCGGLLTCGLCEDNRECSDLYQCECAEVSCGDSCCASGESCVAGECCAPSCDGVQCGGSDGCGGICDGYCLGANETCVEGSCQCEFVTCQGSCCAAGELCEDGSCVDCVPACDGAACGDDDGCGGLCFGDCAAPYTSCVDGVCVCDSIQCGDACCAPDQGCNEGTCCDLFTCEGLGAECGAPSDGCGGVLSCGDCAPEEACGDTWQCECAFVDCDGSCCEQGAFCYQGGCCLPSTCEELGAACGAAVDGCGGDLECGDCGDDQVCGESNICECLYETCGGACCGISEACVAGICVPCVPSCEGAVCGADDSCGGLCDGTCVGENEVCVAGACECGGPTCGGACCPLGFECFGGACCEPVTCESTGAVCGALDNGCGGTLDCGACGDNETCDGDNHCVCVYETCTEGCCGSGEVCFDEACCAPATCQTLGAECGNQDDGCGGTVECGDCDLNQECFEGTCVDCVPVCEGAVCGADDGCGGVCDGVCPGDYQICVDGDCLCEHLTCGTSCCAAGEICDGGVCAACVPDCLDKDCGDADGCGGVCDGPCAGSNETCVSGTCECLYLVCGESCCDVDQTCHEGACCAPASCLDLGAVCGAPSDGCGGTLDCGTCGSNEACGPDFQCGCVDVDCGGVCCEPGGICHLGECCSPGTCESMGAACGAPADNCGGTLSCGTCGSDATCGDDFTCQCDYLSCGGDCCAAGEDCLGGVCTPCVPDCDGLFCGDTDGCGGLCDGVCPGAYQDCIAGICVCMYVDCGENCCDLGEICEAGVCTACIPDCEGAACGAADGCGGVCLEGTCAGDYEDCVDGDCVCAWEECGDLCCAEDDACHLGTCCTPNTCDLLAAECGEPSDGCGGTLTCGTCSDDQVCGDDWKCDCAWETCGTLCCQEDQVCHANDCCTPNCAAKNCGDSDGCGGLCQGPCGGANQECVLGACLCVYETCGSACCAAGDTCVDGVCLDCVPDCDQALCGADDGCGGLCDGPCPGDYNDCVEGICACIWFSCGGGTCCAETDVCNGDQCCAPNTCVGLGAGCGEPSDGCGGTLDCGDCGGAGTCGVDYLCDCDFLPCGGTCCGDGDVCDSGICCTPETCDSLGASCGQPADGCGGTLACGACGDNEVCAGTFNCECEYLDCQGTCCAAGEGCVNGVCTPGCVPDCAGASCGEGDGCGGLCDGPCSGDNQVCNAGVCECLFDACDGLCCDEDQLCQAGICACPYVECDGVCCDAGLICDQGICALPCVPDCDGATCGDDDGCDGLCDGTCAGDNETCVFGACTCEGISCGGGCCAVGETCEAGVCQAQCVPDCAGKDCGASDGCGSICLLGACPGDETCVAGVCVPG